MARDPQVDFNCVKPQYSEYTITAIASSTISRRISFKLDLKSIRCTLAEFYFSRGLQRPYTSTCIILQKTINGFLYLLIVFLKSKKDQLNFEGRD